MDNDSIFFQKRTIDPIRFIPQDEFEWMAEIQSVEKAGPDDESLHIAGYANTRNLDRVGDIVEPTAFDGNIYAWKRNGVILFNHNHSMPIGRPVEVKRDDEGLWIKAYISGADDVRSIRQKIYEKILRSLSIGFRILKDKWEELDTGERIRRITKLELFEVSIVPVPANRESVFDVVKCMQMVPTWKLAETLPESIDDSEMFANSLKVVEQINAELESEILGGSISRLEALNKKLRRG